MDSNFVQRGLAYLDHSRDFKGTLLKILNSAITAVGSDSGSIYLLDPGKGVLEPFLLVNFPPEYLEGCKTVELGAQCCGRAALHKTPWVVSDMWTDPLFTDCAEAARAAGMRSGFSVPIVTPEGECIGTLGCQYRDRYVPSANVIELVTTFCDLIAVAITQHNQLLGRDAGKVGDSRKPPTSESRAGRLPGGTKREWVT